MREGHYQLVQRIGSCRVHRPAGHITASLSMDICCSTKHQSFYAITSKRSDENAARTHK